MRFGQFVEYRGYVGTIEYSPEDNAYYGSLLDIKDTVVYGGDSIEDLYKSYQEIVDDYIELRREL